MKKIISIILSIILIFSLTAAAFAVETTPSENIIIVDTSDPEIADFTVDDIQLAPFCADESTYGLYASRYFTFNDLSSNAIYSDFVEYEIQQGEGVSLTVTSSTWYPHTCDIEIGIYDLSRGVTYESIQSGGSFSGTLVFGDLDASNYMVYVRNLGVRTITSGAIRYTIS